MVALEAATVVAGQGRAPGAGCPLCVGAPPPVRWQGHADCGLCWLTECRSCRLPMVVLRRHDPSPDAGETAHMLERLAVPARALGRWYVDDGRRSIPGHWHAHARPGPRLDTNPCCAPF